MGMVSEFRAFVAKGNVIDLAVAVVIGAAFGKIVTAVVDGLVMPLVGAVLSGKSWATWTVTSLHFQLGAVLAAIIDFLAVALVVFLVFVKPRARPPGTKECPECLEAIPVAARRCRACASPQTA